MNIRSILPKINILRADTYGLKIDVMSFCETWLRETVPNSLLNIDGYRLVRADRSTLLPSGAPKTGGGLCIYYKNHFILNVFKDATQCTSDLETLAISLSRPDHNLVVILNIYRPPGGSIVVCFQRLTELFNELSSIHRRAELYVLGDLNVDTLMHSPVLIEFNDLCMQFGLSNYVTTPTRYTATTATSMDICLTNSRFISNCGTVDYGLSDHLPICCIKKKKKKVCPDPRARNRARSYKYYDFLIGCTPFRWFVEI